MYSNQQCGVSQKLFFLFSHTFLYVPLRLSIWSLLEGKLNFDGPYHWILLLYKFTSNLFRKWETDRMPFNKVQASTDNPPKTWAECIEWMHQPIMFHRKFKIEKIDWFWYFVCVWTGICFLMDILLLDHRTKKQYLSNVVAAVMITVLGPYYRHAISISSRYKPDQLNESLRLAGSYCTLLE